MASREIEWLKREVVAWERDGVVDAATVARLRTRYALAAANETPWGRIIFGSLGALLVGLGIIALLAANWSELGRPTRTVIAFTPLSLCAILYVTGYLRGWSSRAFLEPLGLFWGLSIGAGVALIGQTYHLPQDAEAFTLVWTLLLIPVCYATRALAPVAGFFVGLLTWALEGGGAGKTSILTYTMPFWLLLMAWVVLGERLKGFQWVAVGLALCGLVLILAPWRLQGKLSDFLAVGGAICWAASAVYAKVLRKNHEVDLLSLTAWQMLLGSIPLIAIAAATWEGQPEWTGTFIVAVVYVAILGNAVAWVLWLYILDSFRAGTAGLATLLTPVIGISSAWIQLGERPGIVEGLGMMAIVGALLLVAVRELVTGRRRR